jgi:hypothetical protein
MITSAFKANVNISSSGEDSDGDQSNGDDKLLERLGYILNSSRTDND